MADNQDEVVPPADGGGDAAAAAAAAAGANPNGTRGGNAQNPNVRQQARAQATPAQVREYEVAKRSARAHKGWLTRRGEDLRSAATYLRANNSKFAVTQVERCWAEYRAKYDDVENAVVKALDKDVLGEEAYWNRILGEISAEKRAATNEVQDAMMGAQQPVAPLQQQPPQQQGAPRSNYLNDALKPPRLSLDSPPLELRQWCEKLQAFFASNGLERVTLLEQQSYVKSLIDDDLSVKVFVNVDDQTEVFGNDGVVKLIKDEFLLRYPLFSRRLEFFRYSRGQNQSPSNFVANLTLLGYEADLGKLSQDEIMVFRILTGVKDEQLLTKLLELKEPTFVNVKLKITNYESTKASKATFKDASRPSYAAAVNQVSSAAHGARPKTQTQGQPKSGGLTPHDLKNKCGACGSPKHRKKDCERGAGAVCQKCGKTGHYKSVCLSDFFAKQKASGGGASGHQQSAAQGATPNRVASVKDETFQQFQQE